MGVAGFRGRGVVEGGAGPVVDLVVVGGVTAGRGVASWVEHLLVGLVTWFSRREVGLQGRRSWGA